MPIWLPSVKKLGGTTLIDGQVHQGYARCDSWTERGVACDARAMTRPDIISDDSNATLFPRYFDRAKGAYLWDVDNNRYVDYLLGYGPVVLGHADPRVTEAVTRELARGVSIAPLWSPRQVELTELLTEVIPGGEAAYLLKTGSDATSAAVRLARIHTGRNKVVRWGYNGWHDWAAGDPAGIPPEVRANTLVFDHDEPASLGLLFEQHPDQIACVLAMPFEFDVIPSDRLHRIRSIAREHGALFILDEMRSGFRMSIGGAQQYFDVRADIVALSKAMANGYPISAIVGRDDVLERLACTKISSTFYANPAEMAAAIHTITILRDSDALERIWSHGAALQEGLRQLVGRYGISAEVVGYPPAPFLRFLPGPNAPDTAIRFYTETTRQGVMLHPTHQWFLSAAHTMDDIDFTLGVCSNAFETVA